MPTSSNRQTTVHRYSAPLSKRKHLVPILMAMGSTGTAPSSEGTDVDAFGFVAPLARRVDRFGGGDFCNAAAEVGVAVVDRLRPAVLRAPRGPPRGCPGAAAPRRSMLYAARDV